MTKDDSILSTLLATIAPTVLSTLGAGALGVATYYFTAPNGIVSIGQTVPLRGTRNALILPIDIVSHRKDERLNVAFEVNPPVQLRSITTSRPVTIIAGPDSSSSGKQILRVNGIPGEARTRIFVEIGPPTPVPPVVSVRNSEEAGIITERDLFLESRNAKMLKELPQMLLIMSAVSYVGFFCVERLLLFPVRRSLAEAREMARNLQVDAQKYSDQVNEASLQMSDLKAKLKKAQQKDQKDRARMRHFLVSRISDLQKELDFWRDTLRSYIVHKGGRRDSADEMIRIISSKLRTWSTQSSEQDLESIRVVASLIKNNP